MKPEQMYHELKDLAEKLGLKVSEQNFRPTGIRVRSGHCKVKGHDFCIIDKHLRTAKKVEALAECLTELELDSLYIKPAVREYLDVFGKSKDPVIVGDRDAVKPPTQENRESG
jgi:hypothetical protein